MSNQLLQVNNLGSLDSIVLIIKIIRKAPKGISIQDLKIYCSMTSANLAYEVDGILELLKFIEWGQTSNGVIKLDKSIAKTNFSKRPHAKTRKRIIDEIFFHMMENHLLDEFLDLNSLDYVIGKEKISISINSIPLKYKGLKNLLISVGFFTVDAENPYQFVIEDDYQEYFENQVIPWLHDIRGYSPESGITFEEFKEIQRAKEQAGIIAEEFVLIFEQNRLHGHPLKSHIKIISWIKVDAGYDINSFDRLNSLQIDRYIEVKSYSGNISFYWSRNEIEKARILEQKYFLYLVDRNKITKPNYEPIICQDPYKTVFKSSDWSKDPQSWLLKIG